MGARSKEEIRAWEQRWALPAALASFLAVALIIGSQLVSEVSGVGDAEVLRSIDEHRGSVALSGVMQAIAFLLLAAPLYVLFRAVQARSERVRGQLVGLVLIAPLFLALSSGISVVARGEAADQFVSGEAKSTLSRSEAAQECREQRHDDGAESFADEYEAQGEAALSACTTRAVEDDEASNAFSEASLTPFTSGLGLAGGLAFAIALLYTGLWAMRTGLLSRFWGSLGMASGIAFLLGPLFFVSLIWFLYFGFLLIGRVPGGKPPAWEAAEAIPWPTPGEQAAARLEPEPKGEATPEGGEAREGEGSDEAAGGAPGQGEKPSGPRRKRKRRS